MAESGMRAPGTRLSLGKFVRGAEFLSRVVVVLSLIAAFDIVVPDGGRTITRTDAAAISQTGLLLAVDAADTASYSGSGTTWTDLSGNSKNGTLVSPAVSSSTSSVPRMLTTGSGKYSTFPSGFADFTAGITVQATLDFGTADSWERVIDFASDYNGGSFVWGDGDSSNNVLFARAGTTNDLVLQFFAPRGSGILGECKAAGGITSGTHNYAVTVAPSGGSTSCTIYRDGVALTTTNTLSRMPDNVTRTANYAARSNWTIDPDLAGSYKSLYIYNRALSGSEISSNYTADRTPLAPTSLTSTSVSQTSVALSWTAPTSSGYSSIADYVVEYSTNNSSWNTFADGTSTSTTATVSGLSAATSYYFRVSASNAGLTGPVTASVQATTSSPYAATFDSQGGSAVSPISWTAGQTVTLPSAPTRAGYTFNGWSTSTDASRLVYQTTNPTRSAGGTITYTAGYGKGGSDAAATLTSQGVTFSRIRYRMEAKYNGTLRYADVSFDKWAGATITSLAVPDLGDTRVIKTNVSNLSVDSNWPGYAGAASTVTTGSGKQGRLELWPWDYQTWTSGVSPAGDPSIYDNDDTNTGGASYGSFQVHNLTDNQTVLAWNQHGSPSPDIGFGNNLGSPDTDWTFMGLTNFDKSTWKLQIFIGDLYAAGASYTPASNADFTLYAQWTPNTLNVTYNTQGGSAISAGSTVTDGSIAASPGTPTRAGYTFNGWFAAASGGSALTFPYTHGQTSDFTLYAQWSGNSNTVTYNSQGGSAVSSATWTTGSALTLPAAPTRTGYTFNGWYDSASGGTKVGNASATYSPANTGSFTLYAQWAVNSYTVTYNANNATSGSVPSPQTQNYNTTVNVQPNSGNLARTGYTFAGWNTLADGTGTNYNPYASGVDYVTYACGSGAAPVRPCNGSVNSTGTATSIYTNWGSGVVLNSGRSDNVEVKYTGYLMSPTDVTATFQVGGDDGQYLTFNGSNIITNCWYDKGSGNCQSGSVSLQAGVYYPFTYWFYENGGGANTYFWWNTGAGYVQIPDARYYRDGSSASFTLTQDTNLFAKWTGNTNTVVYNSQGGSAVSSVSWVTGASLTLPAAPTRAGYTFTGWFDAASGGAKVGNATETYSPANTAGFTLYAQWTANTLVVTYDSQGGSAISAGSTVTGGSIASSPGSPVRSTYTFNGWFAAASGGSAITFPYTHGKTADFTLYAQWLINQTGFAITGAPASLGYNSSVTLGVSGGNGTGAVVYATTSPSVCSVGTSTGIVTMLAGSGTCDVAATKAADATYASTAASASIMAAKATQTSLAISGTSSGSYGATVSLSTTGGSTAGAVTWSEGSSTACSVDASGAVSITNGTGTCVVTATMAGNSNYLPVTSGSFTMTVSRASQSALTVTSTSVTYGQTLALATSGGSGTGAVTWEVTLGTCTVSGSTLTPGNAGSLCQIRATKAQDANYLSVQGSATVSIGRASQSALTVTSTSVTYGQTLALVTSGGSGTGVVTWVVVSGTCTVSGSTLTPGNAGSLCQVRGTKAQDTNFLYEQTPTTTISVEKASQTGFRITGSSSFTTGSTLVLSTTGGQSGGSPTWAVTNGSCTVTGSTLSSTRGGLTCVVEVTKAGDSNYLPVSDTLTVTVNKITQNLTFRSTAPSPATVGTTYTVTVDSDAFLAPTIAIANTSSTVCSVLAGVVTFNSAGTCLISASQPGNDSYSSAAASQSVTVLAASVVTVAPAASSPASPAGLVGVTTTTVLPGALPVVATTTTVPAPPTSTGKVAVTTTSTTTTTTTIPADPSQPQVGADGKGPELKAGETTALVRGQEVAVRVEQVEDKIVITLPNKVKIAFGPASPGSKSVSVAADGVLRLYHKDFVDVVASGLVPGTTYTVFMFSKPVELGRGVADSTGKAVATVQIPSDAAASEHTLQVNGVGPGGEVVTTSMGITILKKTSSTGITVLALTLAILLALLGGRPIYVGRRRRRTA